MAAAGIHVDAGFGKDHLKVQVEPTGSLKISGERAIDGRQWLHFTKRFDPAGCGGDDAAAIKVQLDKGMLYIQVPRPLVGGATSAGAAGNGGSSSDSEKYEDAVRGGGEDEVGVADGWNVGGRVAVARREEQNTLRRLARGLSRHRQVVLNVLLAVVLLWLVVFDAKNQNKHGGGQAKNG